MKHCIFCNRIIKNETYFIYKHVFGDEKYIHYDCWRLAEVQIVRVKKLGLPTLMPDNGLIAHLTELNEERWENYEHHNKERLQHCPRCEHFFEVYDQTLYNRYVFATQDKNKIDEGNKGIKLFTKRPKEGSAVYLKINY